MLLYVKKIRGDGKNFEIHGGVGRRVWGMRGFAWRFTTRNILLSQELFRIRRIYVDVD